MKKYILFSNIMMTGLIALSIYGILWTYIYEERIMWGAIFAMLFAIRKVIKDSLKVGFSRYSVEVDKLTSNEKFLHQFQGGLSFSFYIAGFIIIVNQVLYDPAIIFLIIIAILTIIFDIYIFFRKKRSKLLLDNP